MALQQHLGNTGHCSQTPVNLERGMQRPKIGRSPLSNELLIRVVRLFTLTQPRTAVHAMRQRPSSRFVSTQIERLTGCPHPVLMLRLNQSAGKQWTEM